MDAIDNQQQAEQRKEFYDMKQLEKELNANDKVDKPTHIEKPPKPKSSSQCEIINSDDGVVLLWKRKISEDKTRNSKILIMPKQIPFTGLVEVRYNPKDNILEIKPCST